MMRTLLLCLSLATLSSRISLAQARVLSAPPETSLLNITRQWSSASSLGDLRELRVPRDHLELRVWGGYRLTTRTQAVVLRRSSGRWSAYLARVLRCEIEVSSSLGDTASRETMHRYIAQARRQCGKSLTDVGPGARIIATDSLVVDRLDVSDSLIESAWTTAVHAGALELPPRVERNRALDDAFMYVVEIRRGDDYRASAIEHVDPPDTDADRQIEDVYAAVSRVLPPELLLKP